MNYKIKERILKNLLVEVTKKYDYLINELKTENLPYKDKLSYDYTTNLLNMEGFKKQLKNLSELAKKENRKIAIIVFDIDNFKVINTSYGHEIGDLFLKSLAKKLKSLSKSNWTVSRIGGDEFGIAIYDIKSKDLLLEVEKLKEELEKFHLKIGDSIVNITVSLGVSVYEPDKENNILSSLNKAEIGAYQSKRKGKSTITFTSEQIHQSFKDLEEKRKIIQYATQNKDAVKLYLQPIVNLSTDEIIGGELLLRIKYKDKVLIPGDFIDAAVTFGLLEKLEEIQIENLISSRFLKDFSNKYIFINRQLRADNISSIKQLFSLLSEIRKTNNINFVLEITENSFVQNFSVFKNLLEIAQKKKILIALDDFGAGYASFGYVSKVPINILKIDGSLINECITDKKYQAVIKAISVLSRDLEILTIAEFIDNHQKANRCKKFDIKYGQGFLFGKPVEISEFVNML
ncbi:diguanylate cyclase (GGDEF) domain-containing protein [Persephonella hydrogeniphila]|uniref:Diguanylate cyclase (GGDEF) domain-containing protein n=1 Tax=Persephonella hydrogeniphila TaxID=198703 RepID=A0A285NP23_9AQUI|nr:bifunctional diguanylate cyclase/phosphodiesterase [Persephonella hydrogeniphila]SNZ11215.1 diguanylate cyclase (GGDEF) domain-containing protein [Persephonella hydrogeniphila]